MKIQTPSATQKLTRALQLVVIQEENHSGPNGAVSGTPASGKILLPAFTYKSREQSMPQQTDMTSALKYEIATTNGSGGAEMLVMARNSWK
ncbi:hypothetical protein N7451_008856 [Penicillium sp. IBT 35674x]|nr:hypothetical protein N7451_008856 [Penicillium sp. IBT 35674x]